MEFAGLPVGDAARSTPKETKLNAPNTIPAVSVGALSIEASVNASPIRTGTTERQVMTHHSYVVSHCLASKIVPAYGLNCYRPGLFLLT